MWIRKLYLLYRNSSKNLIRKALFAASPVGFVLFVILFNIFVFQSGGEAAGNGFSARAIFGGGVAATSFEERDALVLALALPSAEFSTVLSDLEDQALEVQSAAALSDAGPHAESVPTRDGLIIYRVNRGETLSKVAADFGISLNTILWANPNVKGRAIQPGEELVILPITGVLHIAEDGETLEGVAVLYGASRDELTKENPSLPQILNSGDKVVVPGGKPRPATAASKLPNIPGYFAVPAVGWNWGYLHPDNAVDISNACGTPVVAAAEGLVVDTGNPANWNEGYGGFIKMEHPNGTRTLYAHLSELSVSVGDYIQKKDKIAAVGNTGNVTGATGCHLHFEVHGARNPLTR